MNYRYQRFIFLGLLFLTTVLISCSTKNQDRKIINEKDSIPLPPPSPDDTAKYREYLKQSDCVYDGKLDAKERLKKFPFNKAKKIMIVSFPAQFHKVSNDTLFTEKIPLRNEQIDFNEFKEIITLNKIQIDSLTDILYNNNFKGKYGIIENSTCMFVPENAIIFFDSDDKYFAYIEICFENWDYKLNPDTMNIGYFCNGKFQLIRRFFESKGIKYGFNSNNC